VALRVVALALALLLLPDCSRVTRLGVGPVVAYPGDGRPSYGDALALRRGVGTSDFESLGFLEYEARLLVSERTQAASLGAGYAALRWFGPALGGLSLAPALGVERIDAKGLFNAGLHGGASLGWQLDERVREREDRPWIAMPDVELGDAARYIRIERERHVLTLELCASVDLRGTREPLYALGLLVGLTFTEEQRTVPAVPRAPPFPFGPLRPRAR
jgi:hypothetical protein